MYYCVILGYEVYPVEYEIGCIASTYSVHCGAITNISGRHAEGQNTISGGTTT